MIVLQRVEEQIPFVREIMVSALCLCSDKRIISAYFEDLYGPKNKMFSRNLILLSFSRSRILRMISYICRVECTS